MAEDLEAQWARTLGPYMRVAVLCGGPGLRREATMDYARTVVAQLDTLARFGDGAALASISPACCQACAGCCYAGGRMLAMHTAVQRISSFFYTCVRAQDRYSEQHGSEHACIFQSSNILRFSQIG